MSTHNFAGQGRTVRRKRRDQTRGGGLRLLTLLLVTLPCAAEPPAERERVIPVAEQELAELRGEGHRPVTWLPHLADVILWDEGTIKHRRVGEAGSLGERGPGNLGLGGVQWGQAGGGIADPAPLLWGAALQQQVAYGHWQQTGRVDSKTQSAQARWWGLGPVH